MRKVISLVCLLAVASLWMPAAAASACDDGIDTDGDGPADGDDSGCSPPYRLDDVEGNVWDTDASAVFDDGGFTNSPSLLIPGATKNPDSGLTSSLNNPPKNDNNGMERVVEDPGNDDQEDYGSGTLGSKQPNVPDDWETRKTGFLGLTGAQEYVDPPRSGDCGDAIEQNGETPLECPTDVGMADDMGDSEETVSDVTGKYEISASNRIEMHENSGSHSYDMTSSNNGQNYGLEKDTGGSDYYINPDDSDKLMELDKSPTETTRLGEVESVTGLDSETAHTTSSTSEITGTSCSGENCTSTTEFYCSGATSETVYDHKLEETTVTLTESVTDVHTESDGEGFSVSKENGGQLEVDVTKNMVKDDGTLTDYETTGCGSAVTTHSCDGTGCDISGSVEDHSVGGATTYKPDEPSTEQETFTYTEIKYPDSESDWPREKFLDLDESQTKGGTEMTQVVASGDYDDEVQHREGRAEIIDGERDPETTRGYFSVRREGDDVEFGNDRAVGWSTFDLTMDGDEFATTLTDHDAYDPDGPNGEGDTLVALHRPEGAYNADTMGIVGASSDFGPLLSEDDIRVTGSNFQSGDVGLTCPGEYTKCVIAIDVSLKSLDNWDGWDGRDRVALVNGVRKPGINSGASYSVVAKAGLGESLSACKMYQRLDDGGDGARVTEPARCTYKDGTSPLPYGPYTDEDNEFRGMFKGPEADTRRNAENPVFAEHQITRNQCVFNGTAYDEGSLKDIGAEVTLASGDRKLEAGGHNLDQEVCLNINGGVQGEWHDLDKTLVNDYVTSNSFSVSTGESVESLVTENPDSGADPSTGVAGQGSSLKGGSLEDDCHSSLICGDNGPPYFVPFYEGAVTADYNPFASGGDVDGDGAMERQVDLQQWRSNHPVPTSVSSITGEVGPPSDAGGPPDGVEGSMPRGVQSAQEAEGVHNTVNTSQGSSHGSGTGQDTETTINLGELENSRIDSADDEWSLSPNLSYVVDNYGESHRVSRCHGQPRTQGDDLDKTQRIYANSYANYTPKGGEWVNPDNTVRSVKRGGLDCDLTGKDWGIAYDTFDTSSGALPEKGGSIGQITFVGKGKLIPPSSSGTGGGFGTGGSSEDKICIGSGCAQSTGSPTDEDTDDTTVDETGDTMSGTLAVGKLKNNADLCIGADCFDDTHVQGAAFSDTNQDADSADIIVPDVYPQGGSGMCVGADC